MSEQENLCIARRKLNTVLADKAPLYFIKMKQWFQMKCSKEKFDADARRLLNSDQVRYHNEFLLALLNKVGGLAETPASVAHERAFSFGKNRKQRVVTASTSAASTSAASTSAASTSAASTSAASTSAASSSASVTDSEAEEMPRFDPVDLSDYLPPKSPQGAGSDGVRYVAQETFLPDQSLVVGRFMLAAWDHDLEGVDDEAANIVVVATQILLKNILTAVITQRKSYKSKRHFRYDMGADVPNMWLRNSSMIIEQSTREEMPIEGFGAVGVRRPPTIDEMEHAAAMEMACSVPREDEPITLTLEDVYNTLLENRNLIPHHSVYSVNLERIANLLYHPSD